VYLFGLGDRRKAQNLPGLLRKDVTDEVVLVQPLHAPAAKAVQQEETSVSP
jgi:hypothetical protein